MDTINIAETVAQLREQSANYRKNLSGFTDGFYTLKQNMELLEQEISASRARFQQLTNTHSGVVNMIPPAKLQLIA